ncbi:telomere length regulation protein-domain-containing protein [Infundibulicybe gibba]|nr:telomere length regulation protein-domain-containing protein [Infundibulicybe gibba]
MSTKGLDGASPAHTGEVIDRLQIPVPNIDTLIAHLCGPLDCLGLLPPQFRVCNTQPLQSDTLKVSKHISALQKALLDHIVPTWSSALAEQNATFLLDQYFCPDSFLFASPTAGNIVLLAYSTILSQPLTDYGTHILARLSKEYPIDRIHAAIFSQAGGIVTYKRGSTWEDYIRNIAAVPVKVANKLAGARPIPTILEHGTYFNHLCERSEVLIYSLVSKLPEDFIPSISYLFTKLVNLGVFPSSPPISRSQPSFFQVTLSTIRARLDRKDSQGYSDIWFAIINGLSSSITQSISVSLFASLSVVHPNSTLQRAHIKREACLIRGLLGEILQEREELWESIQAITLGRDWDELYSRVFVCWMAGSYGTEINIGSLGMFLENVLDTWSSQDHIKHSLLSRHHYITSLLLITISYLPKSSETVQSLALSPEFITGIGRYISHLDPSVRRCGMLAAEVVAHLSGKKLDFRDWDGNDAGKLWARELRQLILTRDIDADLEGLPETDGQGVHNIEEIISSGSGKQVKLVVSNSNSYDSDDSMTGYESMPSSRSSSPTPLELAEIERDPTIHVGVKRLPRPVYLAQLGDLIRGSSGTKTNDNHEADRMEMALNCAEELIRRKRGYGTELEENAVNIAHGLLGLQDNYDLDGFEDKRQASLTALVACCPQKAAPALIEEFFKNQYSINQRYVALNALALGARELASLAVPPTLPTQRSSFPSKVLPPALHNRYITSNPANQILQIVDSLSQQATDRGREASSEKIPDLVRERRLRIPRPPKVEELRTARDLLPQPKGPNTFTQIAAEIFVAPLINRFWLFLRDENTREERTAHRAGRERYYGAGTGLILNPVVLSHFLKTMAILVHASHLASEWMSVIAPDALEMAVTLGTKPVSSMDLGADDIINTPGDSGGENLPKEASVLASALELALIVLDGCLELDGGRILGLEHTTLTLGTAEWAGAVFSGLEKGLKAEGGGGIHEVKLRRAAAGVILKVEELRSRWGRSMIDMR